MSQAIMCNLIMNTLRLLKWLAILTASLVTQSPLKTKTRTQESLKADLMVLNWWIHKIRSKTLLSSSRTNSLYKASWLIKSQTTSTVLCSASASNFQTRWCKSNVKEKTIYSLSRWKITKIWFSTRMPICNQIR